MLSKKTIAVALAFVSASPLAGAGPTNFDNFTPLASSVPAGSLPESAPLQLSSPLFTQTSISANNSGALNGGVRLGDNWDMITLNENGSSAGRYLFSPYETGTAGVRRVDLQTGQGVTIVPEGTQGFVAGDASRWTPWGTYLTAEESWGTGSSKGRLFEITNPLADPASINFVQRNIIPRVSHEGLAFDRTGSLYFIDELNGGSIYRYVSKTPNSTNFFDAGQTFVLRVGAGNNASATGAATWVPITDVNGAPLPGIATVTIGGVQSIDGRVAADQVAGTAFNRPEDLEIQTLADGTQALYFAATGTNSVFSIRINPSNTAEVRLAADRNTINQLTGLAVGTQFSRPDNLAIDSAGNIYIVEDQPGGQADIWFIYDLNLDGVAEAIGRWASLSTLGAEPTGLYFDPFNPNVAYLNVQHAGSDVDRTIRISAIPEPSAASLMGLGLSMLSFVAWQRRKKD